MCSDKKRKAEKYTKFKIKHLAITASLNKTNVLN